MNPDTPESTMLSTEPSRGTLSPAMRSQHPELARMVFGPPETLFLGPGFRLAARWNRLGETGEMRKKREKTGKKWARYGLKGVKEGS